VVKSGMLLLHGWGGLALLLQLPGSLVALRQLYLAGTFPINGSDGWQGGQVGPTISSRSKE
jgi:hypothetical protein